MSVTDASLDALSDEARALWTAAVALARDAAAVSPLCRAPQLPPLLFFTDPTRTPDPCRTAARLPAGAGMVYRHFGEDMALETAQRLRRVTTDRGVKLMVGLDAALAEQIDADGVHLPERAILNGVALKTQRPDWLITASVHRLLVPVPSGVDALVLSPIFPTRSPSPARPPLGPGGLAAAARGSSLPIYALGGISGTNVDQIRETGACGIAGVEAFNRAFGG